MGDASCLAYGRTNCTPLLFVAGSLLAHIAERVASGELVDVSLELCSDTPLEGRSLQHVAADLAMVTKSEDEEMLMQEDRKKKNRDKPRKPAPVDEGDCSLCLIVDVRDVGLFCRT